MLEVFKTCNFFDSKYWCWFLCFTAWSGIFLSLSCVSVMYQKNCMNIPKTKMVGFFKMCFFFISATIGSSYI